MLRLGVQVPDVRRAVRLLLQGRGHGGAHDNTRHGHQPLIQGALLRHTVSTSPCRLLWLIKDHSAHTTRHNGHLIASLSLPTGQTTHCSAAHLAACKSRDVALCKEVSQLSVLPRPPLQGGLEEVYRAALALGTANQLTNILRDVGEDVNERNRIYVPLDELDQFGIRESEVHIQDSGFMCL